MMQEHDRVILQIDLPEYGLKTGDIGTVIHIYATNTACEVEFFTVDGHTFEVITIEIEHLKPVSSGAVLHARPIYDAGRA